MRFLDRRALARVSEMHACGRRTGGKRQFPNETLTCISQILAFSNCPNRENRAPAGETAGANGATVGDGANCCGRSDTRRGPAGEAAAASVRSGLYSDGGARRGNGRRGQWRRQAARLVIATEGDKAAL